MTAFIIIVSLVYTSVYGFVGRSDVPLGWWQSPIDIETSEAFYDVTLEENNPLTIDYMSETSMPLINNGRRVIARIQQNSSITGGPLNDRYQLAQFHWHWGSTADKGSEHTIDGNAYSAELHLVHFNVDKYGTLANAADKPDGLAVLAVMIKEGMEWNPNFGPISDQLWEVEEAGSTTEIRGTFDPESLLPGNTEHYWTYLGSVTTPPFYESVTWIVFREHVVYSTEQMQELRMLRDYNGRYIVDNFRSTFSIGEREIRKSFN